MGEVLKSNRLRKRVTGVIIKNQAVLLIERIKVGVKYFIFPGGGVEDGERIIEALKREIQEELTLEVQECKFLFYLENIKVPQIATIHSGNRNEYFFQIQKYDGAFEIGGPEKERMSEENQYKIVWVNLDRLKYMDNVYPKEGVIKLLDFIKNSER